jgi:hypothetical protein
MPIAIAGEPIPSLPAVRNYGPVTYVSRGTDDREILAVRAAEAAYPLVLEFAQLGRDNGDTLSGVVVDIRDPGGRVVLSTVTDRPFLLLDVPDGKYVVTAGYNADAQQPDVAVDSRATVHRYIFW